MKAVCLAAGMAIVAAAVAMAAPIPPTITLIPSDGSVSAGPGGVVGWGFTLTNNDPSDWVVLSGSEFTGSMVDGTYVDYLSLPSAPLYVAGPSPESSTVTQNFDASSMLGVGEFDINSTAAPGPITGNIVVHYSEFSQDPNDPMFNPDTATVIADATLTNPATVNVVPEPGMVSLVLVGGVPVMFGFYRRRRRAGLETRRRPGGLPH